MEADLLKVFVELTCPKTAMTYNAAVMKKPGQRI